MACAVAVLPLELSTFMKTENNNSNGPGSQKNVGTAPQRGLTSDEIQNLAPDDEIRIGFTVTPLEALDACMCPPPFDHKGNKLSETAKSILGIFVYRTAKLRGAPEWVLKELQDALKHRHPNLDFDVMEEEFRLELLEKQADQQAGGSDNDHSA
jgi:hypothetical protein